MTTKFVTLSLFVVYVSNFGTWGKMRAVVAADFGMQPRAYSITATVSTALMTRKRFFQGARGHECPTMARYWNLTSLQACKPVSATLSLHSTKATEERDRKRENTARCRCSYWCTGKFEKRIAPVSRLDQAVYVAPG